MHVLTTCPAGATPGTGLIDVVGVARRGAQRLLAEIPPGAAVRMAGSVVTLGRMDRDEAPGGPWTMRVALTREGEALPWATFILLGRSRTPEALLLESPTHMPPGLPQALATWLVQAAAEDVVRTPEVATPAAQVPPPAAATRRRGLAVAAPMLAVVLVALLSGTLARPVVEMAWTMAGRMTAAAAKPANAQHSLIPAQPQRPKPERAGTQAPAGPTHTRG